MDTITNVEVTTKPEAAGVGVTTNLSIDWTDMSPDDIRALAQAALVVKLQGAWRTAAKAGTGVIPAGDFTVMASEHKVGVRAPKKPADIAALFQKLTAEERAEFLAKYAS